MFKQKLGSWSVAIALAATIFPTSSFAQDDFEAEFDDRPAPAPPPAAQPAPRPQPVVQAQAQAPAPAAVQQQVAAPVAAPAQVAAAAPSAPATQQVAAASSGGTTTTNVTVPQATPPAVREARDEAFRAQSSTNGAIGGIHLVDAGSSARGTFRLQLTTDFFHANNYLNAGDSNGHVGGTLSLSWTVLDYLEVFANIATTANSNNTGNPTLFQTLGDTVLGGKGFYHINPWLTVGGDLTLALLNSVGDIGLFGKGTSVGFRANAAADFRHFPQQSIPLIARFNFQYYVDNSAQLISGVEQARYNALPSDRRSYADEDRQLLTRVERFALGINRLDRINLGLGVEAPLKVMENFYIHPMLEWNLGIPVNRQGYNCLYIPAPGSTTPAAGSDGCLERQGFKAFPQTLSLGVRVLPPVRGLAAFIAVDVGLTGTSSFVRELSPTAPYDVWLGLSYAYDATPIPPDPVVVTHETERRVEVAAALPVKGHLHGFVLEQGAPGVKIANAIIRFPGRDLTALATGTDGTFNTFDLDPGEVQLEVTAADYNPGTCKGTIPAEGGVVEVTCELTAVPRTGAVRGLVTSDTGTPVGSTTVNITGAMSRMIQTDASGTFAASDLPPGSYRASVESRLFFPRETSFTVTARATAEPHLSLIARPTRSSVTVNAREIVIKRQINFATDSDTIDASSNQLISEIADVLRSHANIRRLEIQGHTDNAGSADHNIDLSQRRADAVRRSLIDMGVEASRLEAKGYGGNRPLVPNITPANRARNRRSQFIILEQN